MIAGKAKPLVYSFDVKSATVQSQKGCITSLGSGGACLSNLSVLSDGGVELLIASANEQLFIWQLCGSTLDHEGNQPELIASIVRHTQEITNIEITKNNEFLVTAAKDGFANIYSVFELMEKGSLTLPVHSLKINELDIAGVSLVNTHSHYLKLISAGGDYKLRVWDLDLSKNTATLSTKNTSMIANESASHDFGVAVRTFCTCPAGLVVYLTLADNELLPLAFELRNKTVHKFRSSTEGQIRDMRVTSDGRKLISLEEQSVKVWDTRQRVCLKSFVVRNAQAMTIFSEVPEWWFDVAMGVGRESLKMAKFLSKQETDRKEVLSII